MQDAIGLESECRSLSGRFLEAERVLTRTAETPADIYRAIFGACRVLLPVDAFTICRYDADRRKLRYVFNFEGETYEEPDELPLAHGPTSWTIRHGRTLRIGSGHPRPEGLAPIMFGTSGTRTTSQIHVLFGTDPEGVLGIHHFGENTYTDDDVAAAEWLALRSCHLLSTLEPVAQAERRRRQDRKEGAAWAIDRTVRALSALGAHETGPWRARMQDFQMEIAGWTLESAPPAREDPRITRLTHRELEILVLVSLDMTNASIADRLSISSETVKGHLKNAFRKGGWITRRDVARDTAVIRSAWHMRSSPGGDNPPGRGMAKSRADFVK